MARLLIADNSRFYRELLEQAMQEAGHEVQLVSDGLEALQILTSKSFDAVILDLVMPRVGGARACRRIKADPQTSHLPVIILSGLREEEIDSPAKIGADAYVAKMQAPRLLELLHSTLAALLAGTAHPAMVGFDSMHRREVVSELLQECRSRRALLEALREGYLRVSEAGLVMEANTAALRMLECGEADLINRSLLEILQGRVSYPSRLSEQLAVPAFDLDLDVGRRRLRLSRRQRPQVETGGDEFLFIMDLSPASPEGQGSEQPQAASDPGFRARLLGPVLASAAQEMAIPLEKIQGQTERLGEAALPARAASRLREIQKEVGLCRQLVDDLLFFAGRRRAYRCRQNLNRLVSAALGRAREAAEQAGIELVTELAVELPEAALDAFQMRRVIAGLLDNSFHAVRAMPAGQRRVCVRTRQTGAGLVLEVEDTGPGIPEAIRRRVFEPFFTTHRPEGFLGLGLAVAYGIMQEHGGSLQLLQTATGTQMRVLLPRTASLAGFPNRRDDPTEVSGEPALRRVLVVDDQTVVMDLVEDLLDRSRYRVYRARDGVKALEYLDERFFDLVLIDEQLPGMEGGCLLQAIREQHPEQAGCVVLTTDGGGKPGTAPMVGSDGQQRLGKPFLAGDVEAIIRAVSAPLPGR